ncbi:MAG: DUF1156 domain-containing protein [Methylococcales bacterium]|nr:DUF1156 domain-containing protein [Methylococcales bacterium]
MPTFIETQFPIARLSAESYKERKAGASKTLTGLGKWWGRKPLILIRASILGMLMPASDNPKKDREIFLKILTMDDDGAWQRCKGEFPVADMRRYAEKTRKDRRYNGMMEFVIHLVACDPERNIWRSYSITAGQDLFGDWIVAMNYGRIGSRGTTKTVLLSNEEDVRRYVRQCFKKRENAPKRIGINYKVKDITYTWGDFREETKDLKKE